MTCATFKTSRRSSTAYRIHYPQRSFISYSTERLQHSFLGHYHHHVTRRTYSAAAYRQTRARARRPQQLDRTLVAQPLSNFDYTEVRWSFDILKPCGIRDRKLRHYRSQAATVLGQVYDRDPLCHFRTIAIVFPPERCIDRGRMRRCALNGFKEIWRLTTQNGEKRLLDGYCRVSSEMRKEALGERGGFCIFALGTIHADQAKDSERRVGQGECTNDGKFLNNERLTGILVFGMSWTPRPGPYLFINTPAEQNLPPPAAFLPSDQETTAGAIVIPEASRAAGSQAKRPRDDTSIARASAAELSGDGWPTTGPMDLDNETTHLLDEMSIQPVATASGPAVDEGLLPTDLPSQAVETCSTAPVPIKTDQSAGPSKPGPSTSRRRIIPETIQEEPDVSPETSKADRDTVFPDKGLEGALFGEELPQGETGKGESALVPPPEGENGHSQPASDESSTDSDMAKHLHSDEDVGEEDIDTRRSVQQEIDTLR
ncbi:hypothetical protein BJX65DRAFT_311877 [Aspergillus insuetus]